MNRMIWAAAGVSPLDGRLTRGVGGRLNRAIVGALRGRAHSPRREFEEAVGAASLELRSGGLQDSSVLALLSLVVADTGRACGADRPSLLSGELRWMPVRDRVVEVATSALAMAESDASRPDASRTASASLRSG